MRAKLATLVRESTSERLPTGHWLVICPEDLLGQLVEAAGHLDRFLEDFFRARAAQSAEPAGQRLWERLRALCVRFAAESDVRCEFAVSVEHTRVDDALADAVYWTIAELLTNVRKHAQAKTVRVTSGAHDDGYVFLRVQDDGVGLAEPYTTAPPREAGGLGLWSSEHRLNELDASLEIASADGVTATIKLPPWRVVRG